MCISSLLSSFISQGHSPYQIRSLWPSKVWKREKFQLSVVREQWRALRQKYALANVSRLSPGTATPCWMEDPEDLVPFPSLTSFFKMLLTLWWQEGICSVSQCFGSSVYWLISRWCIEYVHGCSRQTSASNPVCYNMVKLYISGSPKGNIWGVQRRHPSEGYLTMLTDNHEQLQSRRDRKLLQAAMLEYSDTNCSGLDVDRGWQHSVSCVIGRTWVLPVKSLYFIHTRLILM